MVTRRSRRVAGFRLPSAVRRTPRRSSANGSRHTANEEVTMAEITAKMVKELREQTGAGMMDVKAALVEANGDMEEARTILRKKGLASASKKAGRVTAEGMVTA